VNRTERIIGATTDAETVFKSRVRPNALRSVFPASPSRLSEFFSCLVMRNLLSCRAKSENTLCLFPRRNKPSTRQRNYHAEYFCTLPQRSRIETIDQRGIQS